MAKENKMPPMPPKAESKHEGEEMPSSLSPDASPEAPPEAPQGGLVEKAKSAVKSIMGSEERKPQVPVEEPKLSRAERKLNAKQMHEKAKASIQGKKGPFKVVATRPGLYKSVRYGVGEVFSIVEADHFGTWMKLI